MKSTLNREEEENVQSFPCLKEWIEEDQSRFVVLFIGETKGVVVYVGSSHYELGYFCDDWVESSYSRWENYSGQVVLEN